MGDSGKVDEQMPDEMKVRTVFLHIEHRSYCIEDAAQSDKNQKHRVCLGNQGWDKKNSDPSHHKIDHD